MSGSNSGFAQASWAFQKETNIYQPRQNKRHNQDISVHVSIRKGGKVRLQSAEMQEHHWLNTFSQR